MLVLVDAVALLEAFLGSGLAITDEDGSGAWSVDGSAGAGVDGAESVKVVTTFIREGAR